MTIVKKAPFVTGDGQLVEASEVHFNQEIGAPQVFGTMRFEQTSDTLRGLVRDLGERARAEHKSLDSFCAISGRSGHSRIGIDVQFAGDQTHVSDHDRTIELQIVITAMNRDLGESLAELRDLSRARSVDIGRLFIPLSDHLGKSEVEDAIAQTRLLMPEDFEVQKDGTIEIPLDDVHYVLSSRLTGIPRNFAEMVIRGKHGLNLFQQESPSGLPAIMRPRDFLVSAIRISLGPFTAFIQRELNTPGVLHLASRLLDGIRTTGIQVPRHVE
ncbi:MAG: Rossmann fold nucleotide-binding protein, partial [Deltaproteobacteria bacterium]|nr:Rossmann fold nucleotide-binding protein [Deltaproteobacteria bacterium]